MWKMYFFKILIWFFFPKSNVEVAHSPTPSSVKIKASSNGDGKNALDA